MPAKAPVEDDRLFGRGAEQQREKLAQRLNAGDPTAISERLDQLLVDRKKIGSELVYLAEHRAARSGAARRRTPPKRHGADGDALNEESAGGWTGALPNDVAGLGGLESNDEKEIADAIRCY
jgi:hypothetical protein